jgi:hypothetical protein
MAVKDYLEQSNLSIYERRLDALGALLDREINAILVHLAHAMPMAKRGEATSLVPKKVLARLSNSVRKNARDLLELYSYRLRLQSQATGVEIPADMLAYAQMLDQALKDEQTLH